MALVFPANPQVDETFEADNNVTYTWDGVKWLGATNEAGVVLTPPEINSVAIEARGTGTGRFTGETFDVTGTITEGQPASVKGLKAEITESPNLRALTRPSTTQITDVQTVPFADNFEINQLNDNNWSIVLWAGPPFNAYLAFGSGSSNDNMAWSVDGRNWTRMASTYGGQPYGISSISHQKNSVAYHPGLQALYTVFTRVDGSNYHADIRVMTQFDGVWTDAAQSVASRSYGCGWGHLQWNEGAQRWSMCMTSVQNVGAHVNTTMMLSPVGQDEPTSGWVEIGGGNNYQRYCRAHQDGSLTSDVQGWNNSNGWQRKVNLANNDAPQNIIPRNIGSNNPSRFSSFPMVAIGNPVTAWAYGDFNTSRIYCFQGSAPPAGGSAFPLVSFTPAGTSVKLNYSLWIEDLGIAVFCGQGTDATRTRQGLLVTTTDGIDFNLIWTNDPADNEEYDWMGMFWNTDRQELVLSAIGGTNPGGRMGYSQTLGETINMPQLTFVSADGLVDFPVGTAVDQSDGAASGLVAGLNTDARTMIVKNTPAGETWGPENSGLTVLGPQETYDPAFAIFDADGTVRALAQFDPGFRQMNGDLPLELNFPATFDGGNAPDDEIPEGSRIRVELQLTSEANGFTSQTQMWSPMITPGGGGTNTLTLTSPEFADGNAMPDRVGAKGSMGADLFNPELTWTFEGDGTVASYRLVCIDPDGGDFVHWNVTDIPADTTSIGPQSRDTASNWPAGTTVGATGWTGVDDTLNTNNGWGAATPPSGTHNYNFQLDALDADGNVLASGTLTGTYSATVRKRTRKKKDS